MNTKKSSNNCFSSLWLALLVAAWLGFAIYTGYTVFQRWQLVTNGVITIGSVVNVRERYDEENQSYDYYPTLQYEVDGQVYSFEGTSIGDPNEFRVGKRYEVLYEATNPSNGRLNFLWDIWFNPAIMVLLAATPLLIAMAFTLPAWWRKLRGDTPTI